MGISKSRISKQKTFFSSYTSSKYMLHSKYLVTKVTILAKTDNVMCW